MKRVARFLNWWTAQVLIRPRTVFGLVLVSCALSVTVTVRKLEVVTDHLERFATSQPLHHATARSQGTTPGSSEYIVILESSDPNASAALARDLAERLHHDPDHFRTVLSGIDPTALKQWALLYQDMPGIERLGAWLKDNAGLIRNLSANQDVLHILKTFHQDMALQTVSEVFTGFLDESEGTKVDKTSRAAFELAFLKGILENLLNQFNGTPPQTFPWALLFRHPSSGLEKEGGFWEGNRRYLLAFVTPGGSIGREESSLHRLRSILDDLRARHRGVTAGVTGLTALLCDEASLIKRDTRRATWLTLGAILILMILFMKGLRRPLIDMIRLLVGLCWTFGWATVFMGRLHMFSILMLPLLCGLGASFGIHWFGRYQEEAGAHPSEPIRIIETVTDRWAPTIFVAGFGAALAFLAFTLTGLPSLVEFGGFMGMGILFMLLATFTVLPTLSLLLPEPSPTSRALRAALQSTGPIRWTRKARRSILVGSLVLSALSVGSVNRLHFDPNLLRVQPAEAESVRWGQALLSQSGRSPLVATSLADSVEGLNQKARSFSRLPTVARVESIFSLLPENQEAKIALLRTLVPLVPEVKPSVLHNKPGDLPELLRTLERIGSKVKPDAARRLDGEGKLAEELVQVRRLIDEITLVAKNRPEALEQFFEYRKEFREGLLQTWGTFRRALMPSPMTIEHLPQHVREAFLRDGKFLLRIHPRESLWEGGALTRFVRDIQGVDELAAGDLVSLHAFAVAFRAACVKAGIYGLIAVLLLLTMVFRKMSHSLLALLPFVLGGLWTLGLMGIFGIPLQIPNSLFVPVALGSGTAYGVLIVHRWRGDSGEPGQFPVSLGRGILLASLVMAASSCSLMLSRHQGIFSLGFLACAGSLLILAAAVLVLPTVLHAMPPPRSTHSWRRY